MSGLIEDSWILKICYTCCYKIAYLENTTVHLWEWVEKAKHHLSIMKIALSDLTEPRNNVEGPWPTPRESLSLSNTVWEFTLPHFSTNILSSHLNSGHLLLDLSCFMKKEQEGKSFTKVRPTNPPTYKYLHPHSTCSPVAIPGILIRPHHLSIPRNLLQQFSSPFWKKCTNTLYN